MIRKPHRVYLTSLLFVNMAFTSWLWYMCWGVLPGRADRTAMLVVEISFYFFAVMVWALFLTAVFYAKGGGCFGGDNNKNG